MPQIDHVNIHTRDPPRMIAFLTALLGAEEGFRPPFQHPGHWLYLDGKPVIHIDIVERDDDPAKGLVDHLAFGIYPRTRRGKRAEATGCPMVFAEIPGAGIGQIFVTGPEGIKIEVQFRQRSNDHLIRDSTRVFACRLAFERANSITIRGETGLNSHAAPKRAIAIAAEQKALESRLLIAARAAAASRLLLLLLISP